MASFEATKAKLLNDPSKQDMLKRFEAITKTGEMVRAWRKASGQTQKQLADKIGSTQESISRIEQGNMREGPTLPMLSAIANACGQCLALTHYPLETRPQAQEASWEVIEHVSPDNDNAELEPPLDSPMFWFGPNSFPAPQKGTPVYADDESPEFNVTLKKPLIWIGANGVTTTRSGLPVPAADVGQSVHIGTGKSVMVVGKINSVEQFAGGRYITLKINDNSVSDDSDASTMFKKPLSSGGQ